MSKKKHQPEKAARAEVVVMPTHRAGTTLRITAKYEAGEQQSALRDWAPSASRMPFEDAAFSPHIRSLTVSRLRWEVRNNPYLAGLYAKYPEAIGTPSLRFRTSDAAYNRRAEAAFYRWARAATIEGDSLGTLVRTVLAESLVGGEVFVLQLANGRVQCVPTEWCGSPSSPSPGKGRSELNGIITDAATARPVAYRFAKPSASGVIDYANSDEVPADYVIHPWMRDRIAMGRGLPGLLPSLTTARDLAEITRAKTKQIKDVSSVSGVIEKEGGSQIPGHIAELMKAGSQGAQSVPTPSGCSPVPVEIAPGTLVFLEPGEKANWLTSKYEATDYKELIMLMLHAIASPVGLPVELWFSGLGDVNYSGFKGLGTQWDARRRYIIDFLEDKLLDRLALWWIQKSRKLGIIGENPDGDDTLFEWAWRTTAVLDEEKSAKAAEVRIRSGLTDHADEWERAGKFADEVIAKRVALWNQARSAAGLPAEPCPLDFIFKGTLPADATPAA